MIEILRNIMPVIYITLHLIGFIVVFMVHIFNGSYKDAMHDKENRYAFFELLFLDFFFWLTEIVVYAHALDNAEDGERVKF